MAEDCVNHAATLADLEDKPCVTKTLNIHGFHPNAATYGPLSFYGTDAPLIQELAAADPALAEPLDSQLPYIGAEVIWAVRKEMARTVEDILSRRTRALFLNSRAAVRMAPRVAELLARELGRDAAWQSAQVEKFTELAKGYQVSKG
jgi:glycerol-3-phosphate dehydrogenase